MAQYWEHSYKITKETQEAIRFIDSPQTDELIWGQLCLRTFLFTDSYAFSCGCKSTLKTDTSEKQMSWKLYAAVLVYYKWLD